MIYSSSSAFSFGKSEKIPESNLICKSQKKFPAVGQYNQNILTTPSKGMKFSKSEKMKFTPSKTPGFDKYSGAQEGKFGKEGPKYSEYKTDKETGFQKLDKKKRREKTPGPGGYNVTNAQLENTIKKKTISKKFSSSKKDVNYDNKVPGVGKYNTNGQLDFGKGEKNKFSMGKSNRTNIVDNSKVSSSVKNKNDIKALDPGYYTLKTSIGEGVKVAIKGKPKEMKKLNTPGPGAFKAEEAKLRTLKTTPSAGIGKGNKKGILDYQRREKKIPDPGAYKTESDFDVSDIKKINAHTFNKDARMKMPRSQTPGPGAFKAEEAKLRTLRANPCAGIGKGNKKGILDYQRREKKMPDPGAYKTESDFDVSDVKKIYAHTFCKSERIKVPKFKTPGPGQYKVPCSIANVPSYSGINGKYTVV